MLPEPFQLQIASHRQILNTIRIQGEISAAELARINNLQPSTLVYILRSLKSKGLIEISRISAQLGSAGKPPTLWRLVAQKGYIIGLEIIPNEMRASVIDFSCKIIHQEHQLGLDNIGPEKLLDSISAFYHKVLAHLNLAHKEIIGVGIGLTGLVDRERGFVHFSRKLNLQNYAIEAELRQLLQCPVEVVNDANAGALGIKWQVGNTAPVKPNVVFLTLNEKIGFFGAGLILNQVLYEGANGTAGEIFTSLPVLAELYDKAVQQKGHDFPLVRRKQKAEKIDLDDVIACAREGCTISGMIIKRYKNFIIEEIVRLVQLLNPHVIVLGGDITDAKDLIYDEILAKVDARLRQIFLSGVQTPEIQFSRFGIYSVAVGATALILRKIFM
ncbi:ROK family transcriptional regulator [candidate division KSB1 bacterium]|nr:ROK family transcriptional regulator [candidate division KSB1 bacterium]